MTDHVPTGSVVVGVDGSANALLALDWGARQASLEGRPLVLVHAIAAPRAGAGDETDDVMEVAVARVRASYPELVVREVLRQADPREALVEAGAEAGVLVVGARGRGGIRHLLLGSVSTAVWRHAGCPVVVVRPGLASGALAGVVVGVSGEEGDRAVVDFAFRVAAARRVPVTLVHCFWDAARLAEGRHEVPVDEPGYDDVREVLRRAAADASERHPDVTVQLRLCVGLVDRRLVEACRDADLAVVGHRRKPRLNEIVHGCVAAMVVEHAHCTVAVVPLALTTAA